MEEIKDFFISRTGKNLDWAKWIAGTLENNGYTTIIQDWDFSSGENIIINMDNAIKNTRATIVVWSKEYEDKEFCKEEWTATLANSFQKESNKKLFIARIENHKITGILSARSYFNLFDLDEEAAKNELLNNVSAAPANRKDFSFPLNKKVEKVLFPVHTDISKDNNTLLQTYKKEIEEKYSKVKLLDKDVPIKDIYVDLQYEPFYTKTKKKEDAKSCEELICQEQTEPARKDFINMVILGLPGAGKSTLLKYMLYRYNKDENIIPVYVELKSDSDFKTHIIENSEKVKLQNIRDYLKDYFEHILTREGEAKKFLDFVQDKEFIFFCDGLDEITQNEYEKFHKAINKIVDIKKHRAIISSREIGFSANHYPRFKLYSLLDFDEPKQKEYIEKYFKTLNGDNIDRKNILIKSIDNKFSRFAKSPILLSLLCETDNIENIENKAQIFQNAIRVLLQKREIIDEESQERLINFLKVIAVAFFKLDKLECFEKEELEYYANKFFCQPQDEICETLKGKYLDCGLFVQHSKDSKNYKFTHRTIWEYLVAEGMVDRDENEVYNRANMESWEESIKMYVTLIPSQNLDEALNKIFIKNKGLALNCMREFSPFPDNIFRSLYNSLLNRDKLRLIATLRDNYINHSSEYKKQAINIIQESLRLIHKAEAEAKDCEVIYSYISFLEEFKNERVFDELLTEFLDLKNAESRRQKLCNDFGLSFVNVSCGNFVMGRNQVTEKSDNTLSIDLEEMPAREVKISNDFSMSQTLVTNAMYYQSEFPYADKERLNNNDYSNQDEQPVNKVNWYEAIIFAKWLGCTLPTEAEWEYACVGAPEDREKFITPYKDAMKEVLDQIACYGENSDNKTRAVFPIDRTKTNSLGLLDMLGNLREWCMDWYSDDFYNLCKFDETKYPNFKKDIEGKNKVSYNSQGELLENDNEDGDVFTFDTQKRCINPVKKVPGKFEAKCLRGGCFDWSYTNLRPTYRNHNPASNIYKVNGFRLVLKDDENVQSELKHKMIDEKVLNENIDRGIEKYTYNSAIITFDKKNKRYDFRIEKHFTIKDVIPSCYSSHIFANKFLIMDSKESIEFYKQSPLCWSDLNVQVSVSYKNIGYSDYSNAINNLKVEHRNFMDNVIDFDIYYETFSGKKIPLTNGTEIKIIYNYSIPVTLWGNYMNRNVSYSNEPMFIKLQCQDKDLLEWGIEEILSDGTRKNITEGSDYKVMKGTCGSIIIEIINSKPLAKYRIKWNANKYFEMNGINTF